MPQASEHRMSRAREQGVITSQPKATSKLLNGHRAPGQEHRSCSSSFSSSSSAANGFSATASKLRPLPPRPSPLDDRCKKLELDRGRASKRSDMRASASRRGPVKADHALKVPGCAPSITLSGSASFTVPAGALLGGPDSERLRSNLLRSKSISIGDLSQASGRGEEQLGAVLSRLALQERSPSCGHRLGLGALALKRSSSLRRVNVAAGLDGRPPATLLSVRTEACLRTRAAEPQAAEYACSPDILGSTSPPPSKSPVPGRLEEKASTVSGSGAPAAPGAPASRTGVPAPPEGLAGQ